MAHPEQEPLPLQYPIIDSHIHLYTSTAISTLNWTADLPALHPLNRQNSVDDYIAAAAGAAAPQPTRLRGFVFVETDRKSGLSPDSWHDALEEVSFVARIAQGTPLPHEGADDPSSSSLVLAIIPWAPVAAGPESLAAYVSQVESRCIDDVDTAATFAKVKGFRYLVQDKPAGTMLERPFLASLSWLAERDYTFDLGVDARSGGLHQLQEACEMLARLQESAAAGGGGDQVPRRRLPKIVINHFCKPNLRLSADEAAAGQHPDFVAWSDCIRRMAACASTSMKLSGFFSELPDQEEGKPAAIAELVARTKPWVEVVLDAFGPGRVMFGSDWPVCNVGGPGREMSWAHWVRLVAAILEEQGLSEEEMRMVWAGTAASV